MEWIRCDGDYTGRNTGPFPTKPGHYRVLISGDRETDDMGGVIYDFGDYETWMEVYYENAEDDAVMSFSHDEDIELVIAWYGPIDIPRYGD